MDSTQQALESMRLMVAEFDQIIAAVQEANKEASDTQKATDEVSQTSEKLATSVLTIRGAVEKMAAGAENVSAAAEEHLASTQEISAAAHSLALLGSELTQETQKFKL